MTTHFEDIIRQNSQRLADLKKTTEELQRELSEARISLERQLTRSAHGRGPVPEQGRGDYLGPAQEAISTPVADPVAGHYAAASGPYHVSDELPYYGQADDPHVTAGEAYTAAGEPYAGAGEPPFAGEPPGHTAPEGGDGVRAPDPTVGIVNHGRQSAYRRGLSRRSIMAISGAVAVLVTVLAVIITSGGPSWPASVATVQAEVATACQNPDVVSEPGQVNFACAKATRQILWVFALLTSDDNPHFADTRTGRQGLEPITPAQGGAVAASLNLHHPYNPADPIDSIAVAARAINDIIGGATLTGANGGPEVQSGLEGNSQNCERYTGSGLVTSRQGFPDLCTHAVTSVQGQAALVADVYQKWIVGASAGAAHDAAVLFTNANNPGNSQVQAILKQLGSETLAA